MRTVIAHVSRNAAKAGYADKQAQFPDSRWEITSSATHELVIYREDTPEEAAKKEAARKNSIYYRGH